MDFLFSSGPKGQGLTKTSGLVSETISATTFLSSFLFPFPDGWQNYSVCSLKVALATWDFRLQGPGRDQRCLFLSTFFLKLHSIFHPQVPNIIYTLKIPKFLAKNLPMNSGIMYLSPTKVSSLAYFTNSWNKNLMCVQMNSYSYFLVCFQLPSEFFIPGTGAGLWSQSSFVPW